MGPKVGLGFGSNSVDHNSMDGKEDGEGLQECVQPFAILDLPLQVRRLILQHAQTATIAKLVKEVFDLVSRYHPLPKCD